jgi:hypothetical protein
MPVTMGREARPTLQGPLLPGQRCAEAMLARELGSSVRIGRSPAIAEGAG